MKKLILASIAFLTFSLIWAQQSPMSNFYNFNEYLLNPSEAGLENRIEGTASHRIQWQGLEGAPTTTFLGVHGALNDRMGIGGKITVDQTDILKQFNAAISYAYRIIINEKMRLNFGVSGMIIQNSVSYGDAIIGDLADEVINGGDESGITFDAEAGIMLEYDKARLGFATSHLFESGVNYDLPDNAGTGTFERIKQFKVYGSYQFNLSEVWGLEPFVLIRNQGVESFQFEVNALASWKETLFLGAGYRQDAGIIAKAGFQITDQVLVAYAYEFSGTGIASYSNGSHEFMVGYIPRINMENKEKIKKKLAPEAVTESSAKEEEGKEVEQSNEEESKSEPEERVGPTVTEVEQQASEETEEAVKEVEDSEIEEAPSEIEETPTKVEKVEPTTTPEEKEEKTPPVVEKEEKKSTSREIPLSPEMEEALEKNIKFEFEKTDTKLDNNEALNKIAAYLKANPTVRILIEGHTCNMGSDATNTWYSNQRANSVRDYLLSKGVNAEQMQTKAMLDSEPLVPNTSIKNRQQNRRVEIEIIE